MAKNMRNSVIIFIVGVILVLGIKFLTPILEQNFQYLTSDANLEHEVVIALDSWIGYFYLKSPVFRRLMRDEGYRVKIVNDNADYQARMQKLASGEYDFIVATVDSYILNAESEDYPGTIISVIDESRGGDAIVAW